MLIVARRKGQRIRIGADIEVVVTDVSRGEVRLGIVASRDIPVLREEVYAAIEEANRASAASRIETKPGSADVRVADPTSVKGFSSRFRRSTRS